GCGLLPDGSYGLAPCSGVLVSCPRLLPRPGCRDPDALPPPRGRGGARSVPRFRRSELRMSLPAEVLSPREGEGPEDPAYLADQLVTLIGNKRALLPFLLTGLERVKAR